MAQPKPIQNQQSMDEILSSIRRIIDNNGHAEPAPQAATEPPAMPTFDPPPPQPVNDVGSPGRPPLSREDLSSFAEAIDARSAAPPEIESEPTAPTPAPAQPASRDGKYQARFTEDDSRAFARVANALSATAGTTPSAEPKPLPPVDAVDDIVPDAINDQLADIVPEEAAAIETAAAPGPTPVEKPARALTPLVSTRAQQSVGHSFEALSETLKEKAGRDLGEMAEQMMRPMLSDWLDNNLPAIVERLVRAEIERIARGEPRQG